MIDRTDAQLVLAARDGDKGAFVDIVTRHQGMVTGVTLAILGDFQSSEDAAQEAFMTAWQKMATLKDLRKLRPWLAQIARNSALMHLRKRRPSEKLESETLIDGQLRPDEMAADQEERAQVLTALHSLPEGIRIPLVLFYREEKSIRTVSETLGLTEDVTKKRLAKGREMLRGKVSHLIDSVLLRTSPGAVFTASVAGLIGAMLKPTAVAATAFSAKPIATTMTTSKFSIATAVAVTALSIPAGYTAKKAWDDSRSAAVEMPVAPNESRRERLFQESEIVKEWRRLWAPYENNPAGLSELWAKLEKMPEDLRKESFHYLLSTEWARVDAVGGALFYKNGDNALRENFFTAWVEIDAKAAVAHIIQNDPKFYVANFVKALSKKSPQLLVSLMKSMGGHPREEFTAAFEVAARHSPQEVLHAAQLLEGGVRKFALEGIAQGWGEHDGPSAFDWAESFEDDQLRKDLMGKVLCGWAHADPLATLDTLKVHTSIFPANDLTTEGEVVRISANQDLKATLRWLRDHPHPRITSGFLESHLVAKMNEAPVSFMSELEEKGLLATAGVGLFSHGNTYRHRPLEQELKIWEWLFDSKRREEASKLRENFSNYANYRDPEPLLDFFESVETGTGKNQFQSGVLHQFFYEGTTKEQFFTLMRGRSPEFQSRFAEAAVQSLRPKDFTNPNEWQAYRSIMSESTRKRLDARIKSTGEGGLN